jgi:tRNA(fMet)-specific endonuclease VapC
MNVALDTNAYTDLVRGLEMRVRQVNEAERVCLPFVVLAELRAGFAVGSKGAENEGILQLFLRSPKVTVLYPDANTVSSYAQIYKQLRLAGKMIPANDLWVAAIAVQHNLMLLTSDAHFDHVAGLNPV